MYPEYRSHPYIQMETFRYEVYMCVNAACNVGKLSALFDFAIKCLPSE
jgi:hypothetical protein